MQYPIGSHPWFLVGFQFFFSVEIFFYVDDLMPKLIDAGVISIGAVLSVVPLLTAGAVVVTIAHKQNQDALGENRIRS
jgi:hypothetical protein